MRGAIPPLPQYSFMAWCLVKKERIPKYGTTWIANWFIICNVLNCSLTSSFLEKYFPAQCVLKHEIYVLASKQGATFHTHTKCCLTIMVWWGLQRDLRTGTGMGRSKGTPYYLRCVLTVLIRNCRGQECNKRRVEPSSEAPKLRPGGRMYLRMLGMTRRERGKAYTAPIEAPRNRTRAKKLRTRWEGNLACMGEIRYHAKF
jgi:hypothetical protein